MSRAAIGRKARNSSGSLAILLAILLASSSLTSGSHKKQRPAASPRYCDLCQILEIGVPIKSGTVLTPARARPRSWSPSPEPPPRLGPSLSAANYGSESAADCHHKLFLISGPHE